MSEIDAGVRVRSILTQLTRFFGEAEWQWGNGEKFHAQTAVAGLRRELDAVEAERDRLRELTEQLCRDLNQAHDELMRAQGVADPSQLDWPEWTPQANSIRWAERLLDKRLAKTDTWSEYPAARRALGGES